MPHCQSSTVPRQDAGDLVGLFFVGIFLYVQTVLGRGRDRVVEAPYIRSSAQIVLILAAVSIGLSMTLVALKPILNRLLCVEAAAD